jgi:hypothetical protein
LKYRELKAKLADEAEMTAVRAKGDVLMNARIDSSKPRDTTVRGQPSIQYRLRIKEQKARYLKPIEVTGTRDEIARGKQLKQLERERQRVQVQMEMDWLAAKAAERGLELPE